jgi:hypothetical protein
MAQNKLKLKVEALTRVVQQLIKELQMTTNLTQGTLTAFQLYIGKEEWEKLVEELKDKEKRQVEQEKKLDLDVE